MIQRLLLRGRGRSVPSTSLIYKSVHKGEDSTTQTVINNKQHLELQMSLVVRKPVFGVSYRSNTNRAVQPQMIARGLKFRI